MHQMERDDPEALKRAATAAIARASQLATAAKGTSSGPAGGDGSLAKPDVDGPPSPYSGCQKSLLYCEVQVCIAYELRKK